MTPTAIRNRVKRGTLETKPNGNYGRLVRVPLTVPLTVTDTGSETVTVTVTDTVPLTVPPSALDPVIPELRAQITTLETRLKATQDELLAMAQKVGASEAEIAVLRVQAADLRTDRAAWQQQAERLAVSAERRPWWRRLTG